MPAPSSRLRWGFMRQTSVRCTLTVAALFALVACGANNAALPPSGHGGGGHGGGSGGVAGSGASDVGGAAASGGEGGTGGDGGAAIPWPSVPYASCEGMAEDECQGESCCTTLAVPGGMFMMGRSLAGSDACPVGKMC